MRALTPTEQMTTAERVEVIRQFRAIVRENRSSYGSLNVGAMRVVVEAYYDIDGDEAFDPDMAYERHLESNPRYWAEEEEDRLRTLYTDPIWGMVPTHA